MRLAVNAGSCAPAHQRQHLRQHWSPLHSHKRPPASAPSTPPAPPLSNPRPVSPRHPPPSPTPQRWQQEELGLLPGQLAVDPGIINMMTVGFMDARSGKFRTMTLTQGRWYQESGANESQRKHKRQDVAFRAGSRALQALADTTLKTAQPGKVCQRAQLYIDNIAELCRFKLRRDRCEARYASTPQLCIVAHPRAIESVAGVARCQSELFSFWPCCRIGDAASLVGAWITYTICSESAENRTLACCLACCMQHGWLTRKGCVQVGEVHQEAHDRDGVLPACRGRCMPRHGPCRHPARVLWGCQLSQLASGQQVEPRAQDDDGLGTATVQVGCWRGALEDSCRRGQ